MKITHFKNIESTNSYLQNLLDRGEEITDNIVVADFQTSGKGQGKNVWHSEEGKNLLFSIALDMSFLKAEDQFLLTQMVSVAVIDVLKKYLPEENLFIKWPNDIYFNDKKIAGVLIKNEIKGMMMGTSIVGVGLNVNQTAFDASLPNPISLKMITGKDYDIEKLLIEVAESLSHRVTKCQSHSQSHSQRQCQRQSPIANSYINHLYRYKQWAFYEHEGRLKEMMIIGYDRFGRLMLKEKNNRKVICDLKEITFVIEGTP